MTRMRGQLVVLAAAMTAAAPARAHADAPGLIRDVRPTTLELGDTLIIECEGLPKTGALDVTIRGLSELPDEPIPLVVHLIGRAASGGRVLVDAARVIDAIGGAPRRLRLGDMEVRQRPPGTQTWRWRHDDWLTLNLFPVTAHSMATRGEQALADGTGPLHGLPVGLISALMVLAIALVIHLSVAPITGIITVWERKIAGRMQSRFGPNRAGPSGWLQWLADAFKLITKEDLTPTDADRHLFRLAPYLMWSGVFASLVVLPLSQTAIVADLNVGVLYLISVTSLTVVAILIGGWASNSKWSLLGGMRSAAQIVSYEVPTALALLQIALLAGTLSPQEIVRAQGGLPHQWFVFANPFAFACFFIFFIAALAEGNRTPFDLPEAESELVAGYNVEYSGFRFGIFFLAEWTNMVVIGAVATTMFLGGWNVPFARPAEVAASPALSLLSVALMLAKIAALVFIIIWIRWTLPRLRIDQLMSLCWKFLVPVALVAFLGTAGWMWLLHTAPELDLVMRWTMFLAGGVVPAVLFMVQVRRAFRGTRMLYVGERQFQPPWIERPFDRNR